MQDLIHVDILLTAAPFPSHAAPPPPHMQGLIHVDPVCRQLRACLAQSWACLHDAQLTVHGEICKGEGWDRKLGVN